LKNIIKILHYVFPKYWGKISLNFLFTLLSVFFGLFSFTLISPFLQVLFENHEPVQSLLPFHFSAEVLKNNVNYYLNTIVEQYGKSSALLYLSIFVAISVFLKTTLQYASRFVMASLRSNVVRDIRDNLYDKVLKLSLSFYSNERKGDIISRMTNDVNEIEISVIRSIDTIFRDPLTIIFSLVIMIYMSPQLTLFVLVLLPVTGYLIGKIGSSLRRN
jgi:ATP-binding cassette, subfamily B, bacterial MsbA